MTNGEYVPAGDESIRRVQRLREEGRRERKGRAIAESEEAKNVLFGRIAELGQIGIQMVQFEVVHPLGRVAALAHKLNPLQDSKVIRAATIRRYGRDFDYDRYFALLGPREGYIVPGPESSKGEKDEEALFSNGTTGTIMRWGQTWSGIIVSIGGGNLPPRDAYQADHNTFLPRYSDDNFEPRNCVPVWGETLRPLSQDTSAYSIMSLVGRVDAMIALYQAEQLVNDISNQS